MTTDTVLAWHFRRLDGTTEYLREPEQVGKSYSCEGVLVLCGNGFHASEDVLDALTYAPGPLLCRIRCAGEILHDSDKLVCRTRTSAPVGRRNGAVAVVRPGVRGTHSTPQ